MSCKILGVKIDCYSKNELINLLDQSFEGEKQYFVTTVNSEILLEAKKDNEYFGILNNADISLLDGTGPKLALAISGCNTERITGADLLNDLLQLADKKNKKVAVLVREDGLSSLADIKTTVNNKFNRINVFVDSIKKDYSEYDFKSINDFAPDILFVTLGAPWQEKFIYNNLKKIPSTKIAIGVGGGFDFFTNKIRRAPRFIWYIGLEWLWRLIKQPWRLKRIINAVIIFPLVFIKQKFINPFFYRKNVVGFIYNKEGEVLILDWFMEGDYWGLPQGGVDFGESAIDAITREMKEETGLSDFKIIKSFPRIYKYIWPKTYTNSGYKGQTQTLFLLEYNGDKNMVKINQHEHKNWKWVKIENLVNESDPVHNKAYSLFVKKYYETKI